MNATMPYRPFGSQSRVEFIKKKFEGSFSDENDTGYGGRTNAALPCKSNFLQELKDLNLNKKVVNSKTETGFNVNNVNKSKGKVLVKRRPAFRKEKLNSTKSMSQIPSQQSDTFIKQESKNLNENLQKIILKTEVTDVNINKDFKRSKTDTNLLKYCNSRNIDKGIFPDNKKNVETLNSFVFSQSKDSECDIVGKISAQYAVVNKKTKNLNKNEVISLKFSESIRKILESPLPKGPPPKKPPRTFCHVPCVVQANPLTHNTSALTATVKDDIPKLKSKLDKLERVVKIHETGIQSDKVKADFDKEVNNVLKKVESLSMPDVTYTSQSCLPISNCLNQNAKFLNVKKLSKAKSEFYLEIDKADPKSSDSEERKESLLGTKNNQVSVKTSTSEDIHYDLPCINKKNSFETFGKCSKDLKESVNARKADLHYMCTDVINQTPKQPNFLSNINWRNNVKTEAQTFMGPVETPKPSSTTKADGLREVANDLRMGKDGKKNTLSTTMLEECGKKSKLDSINSSDCNESRKRSGTEHEILSQTTANSKNYANKVPSNSSMSQISFSPYKNRSNFKNLFECCLLVGLTLCESKQNVPYIKSVFPPDTKPPPLIEALCFPDASYWPPASENQYPEEQYYSLVVTNENGERKFGYCRRVLPEGGHVCLPLTYCIISPHRASGFFYKVLEELESRHGSPNVQDFIKQLYESEFPRPGERLKLKEILEEATRTSCPDSDIYMSSTLVRRPPDARLEEKDLTQLLQHLQLPVFLKIFSSLLHERKILLLSNSLRNLSSCTEALQSILLPFSWQHTYIPVLPIHLIEMCEAPTPYVIGLLKRKNVEKSLANVNFEDGILVDLDDSKILKCCGDEGSILPSRFTRDLKTSLNLAMNATDLSSESVRSVLISDAFIRFFVQVCGNYSKFIQNLSNGEKVFQKDEFIKSMTSNATQSFLDWFTETAMFNSFIQERLQDDDEDLLVKLFRRRASEYSDENVKDSAVLLRNYRVINRKVRTLGDKIKDFTSFAK